MLHSRNRRIEEQLREAISEIFRGELSDPRLPRIFTVSGVELSKDSAHAKVVFSQLPDDEASIEKTQAAITHSLGYIRRLVAERVKMRHVPELHFHYHDSEAHYQRINAILKKVAQEDQQRAAASPKPAEEAPEAKD